MFTGQTSSLHHVTTNASNYRLLGLVGQGQFGQVFCAVHRATGKLVALKNLEQQRFPTRQFLRELRFLLSLRHPNIVTCFAIEHTQTGRYLVMDYCEGGTLRQLMTDETHLRLFCGLRIIADILAGLTHAHAKGVVHCDIKPENILLKLTSKGWTAKISDFGVARLSQELSHYQSSNTGSPAYMAPERFYGQYSATTDLYSVGIVLFELLTGYRPFSGVPSALMNAHLNQTVVLPDSIPEAIHPIIKKALEKLSARRYQTAQDMLSAIHQAAKQMAIDLSAPTATADEPLIDRSHAPIAHPFQTEARYPIKMALQHFGYTPVNGNAIRQNDVNDHGMSRHDAVQTTKSEQHEQLSSPNRLESPPVCYATNETVGYFCHRDRQWHTIHVPTSPIHSIVGTPHACFVTTPHRLYQLPPIAEIGNRMELTETDVTLVHQFSHDCIFALDPQGMWTAVISDMRHVFPKSGFSALTFHSLPGTPTAAFLRSQPIRLKNSGLSSSLLQAIALDQRRVAIFSDGPKQHIKTLDVIQKQREPEEESSVPYSMGTYIEVVTRRGNPIGSLALPIWVGQVVPTTTPYRVIATDRYDTYSIVQIDLKPFRIRRFAVPIRPTFIAAAPWGYLVMNSAGQIIVLDAISHEINRIEGPPNPTAMTLIEPSTLFVSTWNDTHGTLYRLDLKTVGLDIVF
ncbi:MAG: serine/threonine-protein kinase [Cyanobacteria bacterium J06633_2]